jgi:hypothetical protein
MTANVSIIIAHKDDVLKISNAGATLSAGKRANSGASGVWSKSLAALVVAGRSVRGPRPHGLCFTQWQRRASANQNWHQRWNDYGGVGGIRRQRSCDHRAT